MSVRLYIGNLPQNFESKELEAQLASVGEGIRFKAVLDRETGACRGFGFANIDDEKVADAVIEQFNGKDFGGNALRVERSERRDNNAGGKDIVRGSKFGNHFGFGGSLLLDTFQKKRASLLEAQTGINDTYIVFEWRRQRVDQRNLPWSPTPELVEGLDFSGDMFTVGLKLDY